MCQHERVFHLSSGEIKATESVNTHWGGVPYPPAAPCVSSSLVPQLWASKVRAKRTKVTQIGQIQ